MRQMKGSVRARLRIGLETLTRRSPSRTMRALGKGDFQEKPRGQSRVKFAFKFVACWTGILYPVIFVQEVVIGLWFKLRKWITVLRRIL